ncbi:hypothetical protein [Desulfovibrio sp. UCD-KL4C]|uniref:hypothetical protein n=1 Tax=Desulfovibrio sp. UCD-KL4C TaxID=2578120 RepID=UPI0025BCDD52|nr:hypothetical protein [Desulfovibrio sp. UCD-KL4C]
MPVLSKIRDAKPKVLDTIIEWSGRKELKDVSMNDTLKHKYAKLIRRNPRYLLWKKIRSRMMNPCAKQMMELLSRREFILIFIKRMLQEKRLYVNSKFLVFII